MTEKRVNGYPVPSTGFGTQSNEKTSRTRLHGLSSTRSLSQSSTHLAVPQKAATPESTVNSKLDKDQLNRRRTGFFKEMAERERRAQQQGRWASSVDDNKPVRPPRRGIEKYVKPKSMFYIANPSRHENGNTGASNTANTTDAASTRRPPQRVRSIQRRSASVDDMLNNSNGGNQNLMSFSSDEDEAENSAACKFQLSSTGNSQRPVSEITDIPAIRPSVRSAHSVLARGQSVPLPASSSHAEVSQRPAASEMASPAPAETSAVLSRRRSASPAPLVLEILSLFQASSPSRTAASDPTSTQLTASEMSPVTVNSPTSQTRPIPVKAVRPIPAPRRREPQITYMDLFLDFQPSSGPATVDVTPAAETSRNENPNPEPLTEVLVDLSTVALSSNSSSDEADSEIRSSSASSISGAAGSSELRSPPASVSSGSLGMAASSCSLDSISNSASEQSHMPRRRSEFSLRAQNTAEPLSSSSRASSSGSGIESCDTPGSLALYDKIVWFTENGVPETGIVKWLGRIKDTFCAGIEFVNHVGNSSGKIKGKRLFTTALTKGRFVPLTELILHKDFYEGFPYPTNAPANPRLIPKPSTKKYVPAAIMCVICQDPLLNPEEDISDSDPSEAAAAEEQKEMVTTHCGHLFHATCLKQWFDVKQKQPRQPCPYCQGLMDVNDVIRIYPVQGKL